MNIYSVAVYSANNFLQFPVTETVNGLCKNSDVPHISQVQRRVV